MFLMISSVSQFDKKTVPSARETSNLVVGRIPYLVCAPYYGEEVINNGDLDFKDGSPKELNDQLRSGEIDCAPSSCIEYARNSEDYYIVPNYSTGGRSKIKSVLFLSNVPFQNISGRNVLLSPASATSNVLFQLLCSNYYQVKPVINGDDSPVGTVAIGNEALQSSYHGNWNYCYDLAEEWYKWQGLPFSFGLWIVRKESAQKKAQKISSFLSTLEKSKENFLSNLDEAIENWNKIYPIRLPHHAQVAFFESADYRLTPNHEKSLILFFNLAYKAGFSPECTTLNFLPE